MTSITNVSIEVQKLNSLVQMDVLFKNLNFGNITVLLSTALHLRFESQDDMEHFFGSQCWTRLQILRNEPSTFSVMQKQFSKFVILKETSTGMHFSILFPCVTQAQRECWRFLKQIECFSTVIRMEALNRSENLTFRNHMISFYGWSYFLLGVQKAYQYWNLPQHLELFLKPISKNIWIYFSFFVFKPLCSRIMVILNYDLFLLINFIDNLTNMSFLTNIIKSDCYRNCY